MGCGCFLGDGHAAILWLCLCCAGLIIRIGSWRRRTPRPTRMRRRSTGSVFSRMFRHLGSVPRPFPRAFAISRINVFPQFQFGDSAAQCLHVIAIGIAAPDERCEGGSAILRGVPVSRPQRGHAALTARLDPVVHRVDTRARLSGGLPLLHAAKHKLDGFAPCSQRDGGLPHTLSITGVGHRPVFQTLSGWIAEALGHFSGHHRGREIWFHRPFSFLGTEHN